MSSISSSIPPDDLPSVDMIHLTQVKRLLESRAFDTQAIQDILQAIPTYQQSALNLTDRHFHRSDTKLKVSITISEGNIFLHLKKLGKTIGKGHFNVARESIMLSSKGAEVVVDTAQKITRLREQKNCELEVEVLKKINEAKKTSPTPVIGIYQFITSISYPKQKKDLQHSDDSSCTADISTDGQETPSPFDSPVFLLDADSIFKLDKETLTFSPSLTLAELIKHSSIAGNTENGEKAQTLHSFDSALQIPEYENTSSINKVDDGMEKTSSKGYSYNNSLKLPVTYGSPDPKLPLDQPPNHYQRIILAAHCNCGDLKKCLSQLNHQEKLNVGHQILRGIAFLHSIKILHSDLKLDNILVHRNPDNGEIEAFIADFGCSCNLENAEDRKFKNAFFRSPEYAIGVLKPGDAIDDSILALDIYAMGLLLENLYKDFSVDHPIHELIKFMKSEKSIRPNAEEVLARFERIISK
jgi:serine/threonine protein kinase